MESPKDLEKLIREQAQHLAHLQSRIDQLQAGLNVMSGFLAALLAVVPPERFAEPRTERLMKMYVNAYIKGREQGVSNLSEFPFVPNPPPEE